MSAKSTINKLIKKWSFPLGIHEYKSFNIAFSDHFCEDEKDTVARIWSDWRYKEAGVTFFLAKCEELEEYELEYTLLHEVMHSKVSELRPPGSVEQTQESRDHEERVCTELAMMIQLIRDTAAKGKL